jgi:hypothetical protein
MGKKVAVGGVEGAPDTVYQASPSSLHARLPADTDRCLLQANYR